MELSLTWPVKLFCEFIQDQWTTILPAKSDSDVMFCLQSYQGRIIDKSLVN